MCELTGTKRFATNTGPEKPRIYWEFGHKHIGRNRYPPVLLRHYDKHRTEKAPDLLLFDRLRPLCIRHCSVIHFTRHTDWINSTSTGFTPDQIFPQERLPRYATVARGVRDEKWCYPPTCLDQTQLPCVSVWWRCIAHCRPSRKTHWDLKAKGKSFFGTGGLKICPSGSGWHSWGKIRLLDKVTSKWEPTRFFFFFWHYFELCWNLNSTQSGKIPCHVHVFGENGNHETEIPENDRAPIALKAQKKVSVSQKKDRKHWTSGSPLLCTESFWPPSKHEPT